MATVEEKDETKIISLPNSRKVSRELKKAQETQDEAKKIKVNNTAQYNNAAAFVLAVKEREVSISDLFELHVKNAHKAHKDLTTARGELLKPLEDARRTVERAMSDYMAEQRRLEQEQARKEAEEERQREIAAAKKKKDATAVKELQAAPIVPAPVFSRTPVVSGIVSKPVVKFRIIDESKIPRAFMMVDESKIKAFIKQNSNDGVMNGTITGVEFYSDIQTQTRG